MVSQTNGLVSGPQPNFVWDGYNYSESVEPSYIAVGANSSKAPPVDVQFTGLVDGDTYGVVYYDNGIAFQQSQVVAGVNGTITAAFDPATMPLDPIISLVCEEACGAWGYTGSGGNGGGAGILGGLSTTTAQSFLAVAIAIPVALTVLLVAFSGGRKRRGGRRI